MSIPSLKPNKSISFPLLMTVILSAIIIAAAAPSIIRAKAGSAPADEPAVRPADAIVTDVKPEVTVQRSGGTTEPVSIGTKLALGDTVSATDGGSAAILEESGQLIKLQDGETFTVGQTGKTPDTIGKPSRLAQVVSRNIFGAVKGFFTRDEAVDESTQIGGVRGQEDNGPMYPRNSAIRESLPILRWKLPEDSANTCTVKVSSSEGILWEQTCSGTELAYPEDAPALTADEDYIWEVIVEKDDAEWVSPQAYFFILDPDTDTEIARAEEEAIATGTNLGSETITLLLLGQVYTQAELRHDAVRVLEDLLTRHGDSSPIRMKLARLYHDMSLYKKAKEYNPHTQDSH